MIVLSSLRIIYTKPKLIRKSHLQHYKLPNTKQFFILIKPIGINEVYLRNAFDLSTRQINLSLFPMYVLGPSFSSGMHPDKLHRQPARRTHVSLAFNLGTLFAEADYPPLSRSFPFRSAFGRFVRRANT